MTATVLVDRHLQCPRAVDDPRAPGGQPCEDVHAKHDILEPGRMAPRAGHAADGDDVACLLYTSDAADE